MDYQEAIETHINECRHRIGVIRNHMNANGDADTDRCFENIKVLETNISAMQKLQQYEQIGTLEEVMEAVEKQIPKSPTYDGDGYAPDGTFVWDEWLCPCCGSRFEVEYEEHDCCPNCGQHILWEVEDER